MSYDLRLLKSHIGSIEEGLEIINELGWNVTIHEADGKWYVLGGEKVIFSASTREAVDTFLYGMALAYSVIPEPLIGRIRDEFGLQ